MSDDDGIIEDIRTNAGLIGSFLDDPRAFIVGAVLTTILEGLFSVVTTVINAIQTVILGTEPGTFNAPNERLGLADTPVAIAALVVQGGADAVTAITAAITAFNEPIYSVAGAAGPFSPILISVLLAAEIVIVAFTVVLLVRLALDFIPGGGAIADYL